MRSGVAPPPRTLADQALTSRALELMRAECRAAMREHAMARAMVGRFADFVVSDGFVFRAQSADKEWNTKALSLWARWSRECTVRQGRSMTQVLRGIVTSWMTSGDQLIVRTSAEGPLGYLLQEIEADRVSNPGGTLASDTTDCIGGVELDGFGAAFYYHVINRADALIDNYSRGRTTPVSAEHADLLINPLCESINQTRGEPGLHSSVVAIEKAQRYMDNQLNAANVAPMFGVMIKSEAPGAALSQLADATGAAAPQETGYDGSTSSDGLGNVALEPGFVMALKPGEDIQQVKPEFPQQSTKEFVQLIFQTCAADLGLPLICVMLDPSQTNFHGFKSAISMTWLRVAFAQEVLFGWLERIWCWKIAEWIERGMLEMPADLDKALGVKIIGPAPPSPDLGEDAKAAIDLINNNLSSADMQIERLGLGDGEEIRTQRAVERQREIELGIVPLGVPGAVAMTASEPVPKADGDGKEQES